MVSTYFDRNDCAAALPDHRAEAIISLLGDRFMALNPPTPFAARTFDTTGIQADTKGFYHFDFDQRFPTARVGDAAAAIGELFAPQARDSGFVLRAHCPTKVLLNGECVFTTSGQEERSGCDCRFRVRLKQGFNRFVVIAECTSIGFSCMLGNAMPQWEPCCFLMPFSQRNGEAGWVYRLFIKGTDVPSDIWGDDEPDGWLPEKKTVPLQEYGSFAAWCRLDVPEHTVISLPQCLSVWLNGQPASGEVAAGSYELTAFGTLHQLVALQNLPVHPPIDIHGQHSSYLVLGPLSKPLAEQPFPGQTIQENGQILVWRPPYEHLALRFYVEAPLFGRWTYPLGVTLYGLWDAGHFLHIPRMTDYVAAHVRQVAQIQPYALYEKSAYGFGGVNQQLCWLDALDDCGSFGALMLRVQGRGTADSRLIADTIAHYMTQEQPVTPDGAFCRRDQTIWADDMYMSVPFLCQYAEQTQDEQYLTFAAQQLLKYREILFLPGQNLMAHMHCMIHGQNNRIPWSRGNGWVLFSLSELLTVLPEDHSLRPNLISFFRQLTEGYLKVQDSCGMWHQILDDPESYLESSSTAMFICAFCRGLRFGWFDATDEKRIACAAVHAWDGLTENAIDKQGNLYGVCRGSSFSFSRTYYRGLSWNFNDTHGIGIVMLAGTELLKTRLSR